MKQRYWFFWALDYKIFLPAKTELNWCLVYTSEKDYEPLKTLLGLNLPNFSYLVPFFAKSFQVPKCFVKLKNYVVFDWSQYNCWGSLGFAPVRSQNQGVWFMNGWDWIMIFYSTALSFSRHRTWNLIRQATVCNWTVKDNAQTTIWCIYLLYEFPC